MKDLEHTPSDISLRLTGFHLADGTTDASSIYRPSVDFQVAARAEDEHDEATPFIQALGPIASSWSEMFRVGKFISTGNNGCMFLCTLRSSGATFTVKFGQDDATQYLANEASRFRSIGPGPGLARHFNVEQLGFPPRATEHVMILEQLGPSLKTMLAKCGGTLGLRTVLTLGLDIISAFETLHTAGYIYAYLKLDSFLVTLARDGCRLVELGRTQTIESGRQGRSQDLSSSAHKVVASIGYEYGSPIGPHDDIQSAGLLLVYLLQGQQALPWATDPHQVDLKAYAYDISGLHDLPGYFQSILRYCLKPRLSAANEQLDYAALRQQMTNALEEAEELQDTGLWEKDHSREVWDRKLERERRLDEEFANKFTPSPE